jgi:triosephosphate isomerase
MGRKKIVAGNWKMNTTYAEAKALVEAIADATRGKSEVEKIIFPPFPFIKESCDVVSSENNFFVGAQNCSEFDKGAYTGEVSTAMLQSVGCKYVLVGHSERRQYFNETTLQLSRKIDQALASDLKIIFCFGELLGERKRNRYFETVKKQLQEALEHFPKDKLDQLVLAYEPVWAIGTGETATPDQAQEMHAFVRKVIAELFSKEGASEISILYGGSCNAQNAPELFACPDVDGGLIGGASLKADDFCKIINSF